MCFQTYRKMRIKMTDEVKEPSLFSKKIDCVDGVIHLDEETWNLLLRYTKCRSKKYRDQKKAIKRLIIRLLEDN